MGETIYLVKDPSQYDYVRKRTIEKGSRKPPTDKFLDKEIGQFYTLIAYSEPLRIRRGYYEFTIYYLRTHDRGVPGAEKYNKYSSGGEPAEAVFVKDLMKMDLRKAEQYTKLITPQCPLCNQILHYDTAVHAYYCMNSKCGNYWKLVKQAVNYDRE